MMKKSCVVLVLAGCMAGEVGDVSVQALVPQEDCDPLVCPGNSDLAAMLGPYELDEKGLKYSSRKFRIVNIKHQGVDVLRFEVKGASIHIQTADGASLTGASIVGLKLTLHHSPAN